MEAPVGLKDFVIGQPVSAGPVVFLRYVAECPQCEGDSVLTLENPEQDDGWKVFDCGFCDIEFIAHFE